MKASPERSSQPWESSASGARPIMVFALGCGAGMRFRGPLARQLTDDLAGALSAFPTLQARPWHLVDAGDPAILDPTLEEGEAPPQIDESGSGPRLKFVLFSSLPSDAAVRALTRSSGARLALSGRMVIEGGGVDLALNLWDVGPPNLLWCRVLYGDLTDLPEMIAILAGDLAHSLEDPEALDRDAAIARARGVVGTRSWEALNAFASVTERFRRAALEPGAALRHGDVAQGLASTLNLDPDYEAPRLLLLEHALERLAGGDAGYAAALIEALGRLQRPRLVFVLLKAEAEVLLGRHDAARQTLDAAATSWPTDPRLVEARARLAGAP